MAIARSPRGVAALVCAGAILGSAFIVLRAQVKRPMALNDLLTAVRVTDPQLSPDGRRVLYVRTTTALDTGKRNADIWTVPADGSAPPKAFITGDKSDNSPRFLADGHVVFISTRDGAGQVYLADANGANVKPITKLSEGVQPPLVVSAEGRKIAYVSDVFPRCNDDACNRQMREEIEKDPVKMRRLTSLPYRHWDEWRVNIRHHVFVTDVATGETRDVTPGDYDSPQHNYEDYAIEFSPDGRTLAFASNREGKDREMWSTNRDVFVVPIAGGEAKKITQNPAADEQPTYSPDGKTLVVRSQRRAGFEADRWYLDAYDVANPSAAKRTIFETPDLSVEEFRFSPDGRTIWFTAQEKGATNLYSVPASGGTPKRVESGGVISQIQPGANFVVFSKATLTSPAELFRSADGRVAALTNENVSWLSQVEMPKPESLTVTGAAGASVQYWLLKPPAFDATKKYPLVFMIHGGPQGAWEDSWSYRWNPSLWAAQGWVIAAPNPRGSTGFGQKFVDEISQDWCGKVMTDLNAVFDTVEKLPYVDAQRAAIAGASYGGYAVDWVIGHSNRFKAAVSHDGVFNLESMTFATEELWFPEWEFGGPPWSAKARENFARCSPHLSADKIKTPTLVITNEQDFRVPVDQGLQLFTALRRNGVPSEALVFPDEGHWVLGALNSKRWHESVFGWMKKYLQ